MGEREEVRERLMKESRKKIQNERTSSKREREMKERKKEKT
jgi:hypothetical protein